DRRADYTQLLRQVPQVSQLSLLNAQGREQLRLTRQIVTLGSDADFSRDARLIETASRGTSFAPAYFRGERPLMSIVLAHADGKGNAVLTTSSLVPKLGWHVFFEQETAQALTPIRDQLARIALLIALGLVVAIIAGTIMARRMLVPITALQAGARRLGAGEFGHRIEVKTSDELEELANQFNGMAGQLAETYSNLESKVKERTRDLAQSIN